MIDVQRVGEVVHLVDGELVICVPVADVPALCRSLARAGQGLDDVEGALVAFGVERYVARQLAPGCTLGQVRGWIDYAGQAEGLKNARGFVVARLRAGEWAPTRRDRFAVPGVMR